MLEYYNPEVLKLQAFFENFEISAKERLPYIFAIKEIVGAYGGWLLESGLSEVCFLF
ncbi:MAG: hypothetical protein LIP11_07050 [Clostridiales bacterium]|nr:hypothetical protein [Clostridiales bacterium]